MVAITSKDAPFSRESTLMKDALTTELIIWVKYSYQINPYEGSVEFMNKFFVLWESQMIEKANRSSGAG